MLMSYFRKSRSRIKKGVMVAVPVERENVIKFGFSLCNTKLDDFDRTFGVKIAVDRARRGRPLKIPDSMKKEFVKFKDRCVRYYKQLEVYSPEYTPGN